MTLTMTAEPPKVQPDLRSAAYDATLYTVPIVIIEEARRIFLRKHGANTLVAAPDLVDHTHRWVTTPNNDTLYAQAWLDLDLSPAKLTVPSDGDRYVSLALMDMHGNNFAVLSNRTIGNDGATVTVIGPDVPNKDFDGLVVRSPTRHVWALYRILVAGEQDLEAARAVQARAKLEAEAGPPVPIEDKLVNLSSPWQAFLREADRLIAFHRPPVTDEGLLRRMRPLGLGDGQFDPAALSEDEAALVAEGVNDARAHLVSVYAPRIRKRPGWVGARNSIGDYGQDYHFRAIVAVGGLGALPMVEAFYWSADAFSDGLLIGSEPRRLHIPADAPVPTNAFWSLSIYGPEDDGRMFFVDNPIRRYAIGDRTPGIQTNPDGSLDIWIAHDRPEHSPESNWLPAPEGAYKLVFRAYLPQRALLDGRYLPPEPKLIENT